MSDCPTLAAKSTVTLRFHPDTAQPCVMSLWRDLERQHPLAPLAASADWTEAWLEHYGSAVPHRFALWQRDDRPVAIALLTQGEVDPEQLVPVHTRHIGTAGEADADAVCVEYNALLCLPGHEFDVWTSLLEQFSRESDWDELHIDGFGRHDLPASVFAWPDWEWTRKPAAYVDLDAVRNSGEELVTFFGDSTRKGIRQNLRYYGNITTEWAAALDQSHEVFSELIELHQKRWQADGQPGCYASPTFTAFHRNLIERLVPQQRMVMFRVRAGEDTLGCSQLLVDRGRILVYQGGRQTGDSKRSPGLVTDYLGIHAALERGYSAFDFMAGDSVHKQRLSTHRAELVWGVCRRPRLKFAILDQLRQIKRWLRSVQSGE